MNAASLNEAESYGFNRGSMSKYFLFFAVYLPGMVYFSLSQEIIDLDPLFSLT
jgi:hypothetical protein